MDPSELTTAGALSDVADEDRAALAEIMRIEDRPRGHVLVEEGDIPDKFFLLVNGHVTVHRSGRHVADLGPGDVFGETGVLALKPRNASVIATTPVRWRSPWVGTCVASCPGVRVLRPLSRLRLRSETSPTDQAGTDWGRGARPLWDGLNR